jgi:hypothetical protein
MRRPLDRAFRALMAALCLAFTPASAQDNNTPGPGKALGNTAGSFQVRQKSDQTCIGGRGSCGKAPENIVGGLRNVHPLPPGGPARGLTRIRHGPIKPFGRMTCSSMRKWRNWQTRRTATPHGCAGLSQWEGVWVETIRSEASLPDPS